MRVGTHSGLQVALQVGNHKLNQPLHQRAAGSQREPQLLGGGPASAGLGLVGDSHSKGELEPGRAFEIST